MAANTSTNFNSTSLSQEVARRFPCNRTLDLSFWILDGMVGVVIFVGNVFTCMVFLSKPSLRQNYMNIFLLSLACADTLMALFVVPWFAAFCEATGCVYPLSKYCLWFGMLRDIPFEGVVLNLVAITYDRHLAVFRPLLYAAKMTKRRVVFILCLVWFLPVATGLLRTTWTFSDLDEKKKKEMDRSYNIFLIFVFVLMPIFAVFIVNIMIMLTIQKHKQRVAPQERSRSETSDSERRERVRKRKGTMSCVLVVLVFFVCWLPRIVYNLFFLAQAPQLASSTYIKTSMFFLLFQSSVNPFIYSFYRQEFRQAAYELLRIR
ncbi:hypothetical protein QZH41_000865 [Actinostola sp. cb2023]|nr:hypothetical protein QZH41_000865 [Actinostola sp. cb2023]